MKIWERYDKDKDDIKRKNRSCPKCGQGTLMAEHKNRYVCGKCQYTEYKKKE